MNKVIFDSLAVYLIGTMSGIMLGISIGMRFHKEIRKILTRGQKK